MSLELGSAIENVYPSLRVQQIRIGLGNTDATTFIGFEDPYKGLRRRSEEFTEEWRKGDRDKYIQGMKTLGKFKEFLLI